MAPSSSEVARHYALFQVQTASHSKRICMLHVRCVELVMMALEDDETERRSLHLGKAKKIIAHLQATLLVNDEASKGLNFLYNHCYLLLTRGEPADCRQALEILVELRSTFEQLLKTI